MWPESHNHGVEILDYASFMSFCVRCYEKWILRLNPVSGSLSRGGPCVSIQTRKKHRLVRIAGVWPIRNDKTVILYPRTLPCFKVLTSRAVGNHVATLSPIPELINELGTFRHSNRVHFAERLRNSNKAPDIWMGKCGMLGNKRAGWRIKRTLELRLTRALPCRFRVAHP